MLFWKIFIPMFHLDNGDMKGMKSKDIIGHECKFFFHIDMIEIFC
jgi:hypothetical protein